MGLLYSCFLLIGLPQKKIFLKSHLNWFITKKILKHWTLPNISTRRCYPIYAITPNPKNRNTQVFPFGLPLYSLYTWKFNFGQSICDKSVVLLGTPWGTHWEHCRKPFRNWWEHIRNSPKETKIQTPTHNPFHTKLYPLLFASSLDSNLSKIPRKEVILWPPLNFGGRLGLHTCVLFVRNQKKRNNRTTIDKPSQIMHSFSHAIRERHSQDLCAINQSIK